MLTIRGLGKRFGLSRSTLLYYDSIGLLKPSGRAANGYRVYSEADAARLQKICFFRKTGASLNDVRTILDEGDGKLMDLLEKRLVELTLHMEALQEQQRIILDLMKNEEVSSRDRVFSLDGWTKLFRRTGLDEEAMRRWHAVFEETSSDSHKRFLKLLGIPDIEIKRIRKWSQAYNENQKKTGRSKLR